jgi:hypothetical protein
MESSRFTRAGYLSNSLFPRVDHPFLIVTPPFTTISAGVTVLHLLCHYLNLLGETAYIVHYPPLEAPLRSLPGYVSLQDQPEFPAGLLAPLITQNVLNYYDERKLTPIVIYPEVLDNPLQAKFFGRYILNYPGKLASAYKQKENFALAYSDILAKHCTKRYPGHPPVIDTLFMPTSDLNFWNQSGAASRRRGSCYYAGKLQHIHKRTPKDIPPGSIEILRSGAMTRSQIRELFWHSEVFYCYEDTALGVEALLCGCPTVFVPNDFFDGQPLGRFEHGTNGWCLAGEPGGLERAKATVCEFAPAIRALMADVPGRIANLAAQWKALAAEQDYTGSISYPFQPRMVFFMQDPDSSASASPGGGSDFSSARPLASTGRNRLASFGLRLFNKISLPAQLVSQTIRDVGLRGVFERATSGLRRHGFFGFVALLFGVKRPAQTID